MSYRKVSSGVAATVMALAIVGSAYGETGKSPNGAPGPEGNPNPPAAQPQANGPQGPAGNEQRGRSGTAGSERGKRGASHGKSGGSHGKSGASHGKSGGSHGKSGASHGKRGASHGKSGASHGKRGASHGKSGADHGKRGQGSNQANPSPGTPRKGGRSDRPAGKITICHATRSETNPYVEITISVNGLHGHGPAEDPRHHEGSWKDIIPAPEGGCPETAQTSPEQTEENDDAVAPATPDEGSPGATTESTTTEPADGPAEVTARVPGQFVLGERQSGQSPASDEPDSAVLGEQASGSPDADEAVLASERLDDGDLPFTGLDLVYVLVAAAAALLAGFALRRVARADRA